MRESPQRYYEVVKTERIHDEREPGALTVYSLNNEMKREEALLAISIAILEVKEWFNVKGNMTDRQVKMTAEMILDYPLFHDLSIGNIKACFRERMMNEKLYDRLDGNIIIGWLKQFNSELKEQCYNNRLTEDKKIESAINENNDLERRALDLLSHLPKATKYRSKSEDEAWRRDFARYKAEYLLKKKKESDNGRQCGDKNNDTSAEA